MTAAQRTMLFSLFARLAKAMGWGVSQRELQRAQLTADVFGEAISWGSFDDSHVDRMKRRLLACLNPNDLAAQRADTEEGAEEVARKRVLFGIDKLMQKGALNDAYVRKLSVDFFDIADWRDGLPIPQLENLRNTLANRVRRAAPGRAGSPSTPGRDEPSRPTESEPAPQLPLARRNRKTGSYLH